MIVDLIGFGIVMPILPYWARAFDAGPTAFGLLMMSYAAAQFVCAPLLGRLSDRIGRRPVMLVTIGGTALALLGVALADSLVALFAARILGGAFAANVSVASAYIADVTDEEERTRWMGMLGACFAVGFTLGPALGGALSLVSDAAPFLFAAGLAAVNLVVAAFALREPPAHSTREAPAGSRLDALRSPLVLRLCAANLAFSLAVSQLEVMFAFFMMDRFGVEQLQFAMVLLGMAVVMGGIQGGGMRALAARFEERKLVVAGALMLSVAFVLIPAAPTLLLVLLPLTGSAIGRAIAQPSLMSTASMAADAGSRGLAMGTFQSAASLARVIGPLLAGWLYALTWSGPFWLAAALALVVAVLALGLPGREPRGV